MGQEWVHEGEPWEDLGNPESWGAGKAFLHGVTGDLVELRTVKRAKPLAAGRSPGALAGCRLCCHHAHVPLCHPSASRGTSQCPGAPCPRAGTVGAPSTLPKTGHPAPHQQSCASLTILQLALAALVC